MNHHLKFGLNVKTDDITHIHTSRGYEKFVIEIFVQFRIGLLYITHTFLSFHETNSLWLVDFDLWLNGKKIFIF